VILSLFDYNYRTASRAVSLGVVLAQPGTFQWSSSNTFSAKSWLGKFEVFEGSITDIQNNRVMGLKYRNPINVSLEYFVEYDYKNSKLPTYLPSHIHYWLVNHSNGVKSKVDTMEILEFSTREGVMDETQFNPNNLITTNNIAQKVFDVTYTNGESFTYIAGKKMVTGKISFFSKYQTWFFYGIVTLLTGIVFWMYRLDKKTQRNLNEKRAKQ
jgi:hypothetical protein